MAIIPQRPLFGWKEIEELGDLERLRLVIRWLPDEELMRELERERANGRDDYPVRAVWNSFLAGVVYQHPSPASLIRELSRNGQLLQMCGFDVLKGVKAVPPEWVYSRFLRKLLKKPEKLEEMFVRLVKELCAILPDLGKVLAIDGKAIASYARGRKREEVEPLEADGRRDVDADFGKKVYRGKKADGTLWEKTMSWFGYRLHLVVDAIYELPMGFEVTRASESEVKVAPGIFTQMEQQTPEVIARCEYMLGDRGYDDGKLVKELWDNQEIKPVIDIRNMWRDGEETKLVSGTENIAYNYCGQVYCYCPETNQRREMAYGGFEKGRETLKYRCPARHYGVKCRGMAKCPVKSGIRIPLKEDRRIFTPLARSSYQWEKLYKKRTAVERVNSRLDNVFGFERHFIRGLKKMKLRCTLALVVMLAMALGRIKEKNGENLRSLVEAA